ncbi:MAG: alpha/beta fold hydrolase [Actinomycetota bacterium]
MEQVYDSLEIDGQRTRVLSSGQGRPVVVLHGWGARIEAMTPVTRCLSSGFRVIAIDLPGFGDAPPPATVWGTPDYAAFVVRVLEQLDVGPAHLVGHSYGAKTALLMAAREPARVEKLVLVGSPGLRMPPSMRARAKRIASRGARVAGRLGAPGKKVRALVYERIASQDYRDAGAMRDVLVRVVNEDLTELLPRIGAPTLLVWGTEDDAVPVAHARRMEQLIPDAGLVLLEGAGHFAYLDEPDRFCRIVRHFLGAPS